MLGRLTRALEVDYCVGKNVVSISDNQVKVIVMINYKTNEIYFCSPTLYNNALTITLGQNVFSKPVLWLALSVLDLFDRRNLK